MKPICVKCRLFFKPERNGVAFEEGAPKPHAPMNNGRPTNPDHWESYKLWMGDLWKCRGCGAEIIVGASRSPVSVRHMPNYASEREACQPIVRVDDC
jgi:hypothetical protein